MTNRATIATHSQNPELIASVFNAIVEHLPHEAPQFFTERMKQMAVIDYPEPVRKIVRRYYLTHMQRSQLH